MEGKTTLDEKIDKILNNYGKEQDEEIKYLTGFNRAIVGISTDHRVIYSMPKMIAQIMEDDDCDEADATEWIEYNTLRTLPYMGKGAPIIINTTVEELLDFYDYEEDQE